MCPKCNSLNKQAVGSSSSNGVSFLHALLLSLSLSITHIFIYVLLTCKKTTTNAIGRRRKEGRNAKACTKKNKKLEKRGVCVCCNYRRDHTKIASKLALLHIHIFIHSYMCVCVCVCMCVLVSFHYLPFVL